MDGERRGGTSPMPGARPFIGLSNAPTEHVLRAGGQEYFLCCAVDLLLNAIHGPVDGRTRCPACGSDIRVKIDETRISVLQPASTVALVHETESPGCGTEVVCSDSMLFDTKRCLVTWRAVHSTVDGRAYQADAYLKICGDRQKMRRSNPQTHARRRYRDSSPRPGEPDSRDRRPL
jgi:hypothetical protein